jgi:hypothetical protein
MSMQTRACESGSTRRLGALAGLAVASALVPGVAAAQAGKAAPVTFTKDVLPILQRSCQNCHRPGSLAPMPFVTYEHVRPWARSIKTKTAQREMPPWFIERNVGIQKYKDDISLSDEEIATIGKWVDSGAPRGNPADAPPELVFKDSDKWTFTPDLIVTSPVHTLEAVAADWYGLLDSSPTGLTEDRWIKAVEVKEVRLKDDSAVKRKAGDLSLFVVHHAVITANPRSGDDVISTQTGAEQQLPQYRRTRTRGEGGTFSITHEVGQNATFYPDTLGVKLAAGSSLTWDLHLHSIGVEMPFKIEVAFKFHPKGYTPKYTGSGGLESFLTFDLDIPQNDPNVKLEGIMRVARPGMLMTFEPHLHSSGKRMCIDAIYPSGFAETLSCAGYNHNWVKVYVYEDDVVPLLPQGTLLKVTAWYDNTDRNPRVVDPRNWKGYGNRSIDDMFLMLGRFVPMTDEQFKEAVAEREARQKANRPRPTQQQQQQQQQ